MSNLLQAFLHFSVPLKKKTYKISEKLPNSQLLKQGVSVDSYFIQENEKTEDLYNPALHNKETSVTLLLCKFLVILQHQVQYINYLHVI